MIINYNNDSDLSRCRQFLDEVFGNKPSGAYFNIWTAPNKKSKFFKDIDKAADYISKINDKNVEIYIQTGNQFLAVWALGFSFVHWF